MISIKSVEKVVKNKSFIKRYVQGKNLPLNYYYSDVKVNELANGEYNYNYLLIITLKYPSKIVNEKAIFRINYGSQMHLKEQMLYEYHALEYLKMSGVTPTPVFIDISREYLSKDYLVMDFIEGKQLDYRNDLLKAAKCLASVHSYKGDNIDYFVEYENPFEAILNESNEMYSKYRKSAFFDEEIDLRIEKIFNYTRKVVDIIENKYCISKEKTLINTELNSSNFIVDGERCILIDWEKPIIGEIEQDLGHFLAPTTTFWKTDIILEKEKIEEFLLMYYNIYIKNSPKNEIRKFAEFKKRVYIYIVFNCLRGLTWCSMAWVEYNNSEKSLLNEFTYNKLIEYLNPKFIDNVIDNFL